MFCNKCGALNEDASKFCAVCGADLIATEKNINSEAVVPKQSIFKKWWFWLIVAGLTLTLIVGITIMICDDNDSSSGSSGYSIPVVSPYVRMVKEATNSNYGITYGAAFDNFFSDPEWSHFTSTDGKEVVEFEGGFTYSGSPAKAKFQFVVNESEGTMQVYHLSINGEAQNKLMIATFVKKVFESY